MSAESTRVGPEVKQGSSQNLFQIVAKLAGVEGFFSESWRSVGVARKSVISLRSKKPDVEDRDIRLDLRYLRP